MSIVSDENWSPPPYSHELANHLRTDGWGAYYAHFPDEAKRFPRCCYRSVPGFHPDNHCKREAVWWHPDFGDAYCDFHASKDVRKTLREAWIVTKYSRMLNTICLFYPYLDLYECTSKTR